MKSAFKAVLATLLLSVGLTQAAVSVDPINNQTAPAVSNHSGTEMAGVSCIPCLPCSGCDSANT